MIYSTKIILFVVTFNYSVVFTLLFYTLPLSVSVTRHFTTGKKDYMKSYWFFHRSCWHPFSTQEADNRLCRFQRFELCALCCLFLKQHLYLSVNMFTSNVYSAGIRSEETHLCLFQESIVPLLFCIMYSWFACSVHVGKLSNVLLRSQKLGLLWLLCQYLPLK